jgi:hypothetical protein
VEQSSRPAPSVGRRAAAPPATPAEATLSAPPEQTRLPIGGGTAGGGGGVGSVAPPVAAWLATLALSLATILLARFSLYLPCWRSTELTLRLENPG